MCHEGETCWEILEENILVEKQGFSRQGETTCCGLASDVQLYGSAVPEKGIKWTYISLIFNLTGLVGFFSKSTGFISYDRGKEGKERAKRNSLEGAGPF